MLFNRDSGTYYEVFFQFHYENDPWYLVMHAKEVEYKKCFASDWYSFIYNFVINAPL